MRVNKKMRKGALRSALTDAFGERQARRRLRIAFDEPKTKRAAELLGALELTGKVLVVLDRPTDDGAVEKSFRNLTDVRVAYAGGLGTYDVLLADRMVLTAAALDAIEGRGDGARGATRSESATEAEDEGEAS